MQDSNMDPHNPQHSHNQIPWSPPTHPRTITGTAHAVTLIASLMSIVDAATLQAANLLEADDLYLAAATVECGAIYLLIAEPVIEQYVQDPAGFAALEESQQRLAALKDQIIQSAGQNPLYDEAIFCLRAQAQAILVLPQLQILHEVLVQLPLECALYQIPVSPAHRSRASWNP